MKTVEKITDEMRQLAAKRLEQPFTFAFLVSWCIWNYKFIYILITGIKDGPATVKYLSENYDFWRFLDFKHFAIYPVCSATLFILFYPKFANYFYRKNLEQEDMQNRIMMEVYKKKTLSDLEWNEKVSEVRKELEIVESQKSDLEKIIQTKEGELNLAVLKMNDAVKIKEGSLQESVRLKAAISSASRHIRIGPVFRQIMQQNSVTIS